MIYSAITGGKDKSRDDIKVFSGENQFTDPRREARMYKTLFHHFTDDDYSIWVDGNVFLKHPEEWYYELLGDYDIAVVRHPFNKNTKQESDLCLAMGKGEPEKIKQQMKDYGYIENDLAQTCIVVRRNTPEMQSLCEKWWAHICRYSVRDQISFPYVFKDKVKYLEHEEGGNPMAKHDNNLYFNRYSHNHE